MTIAERIAQNVSERGLLKKTVYEAIGVSASTYSTWIGSNVVSIPSEYVPGIARVFGITCDELLTGETQIVPTEDERNLLETFRGLSWDSKQVVLAALVNEKRRCEDAQA